MFINSSWYCFVFRTWTWRIFTLCMYAPHVCVCIQSLILWCVILCSAKVAWKQLGYWILRYSWNHHDAYGGVREAENSFFWLRIKLGHIVHCTLNLIKKFKDCRCFDIACWFSKEYCLLGESLSIQMRTLVLKIFSRARLDRCFLKWTAV